MRIAFLTVFFCLLLPCLSPNALAADAKLSLPPEASSALDKIYAFDLEAAVEQARYLQKKQPGHPLGYVLEAEAVWWKMWCASADFKYGMTDARRRGKLPGDQHYLDLAAKASALADIKIREHSTAEMEFYAGMADALSAQLYSLRGENRNTARVGVRAREHFLRAIQLDPDLADADFGLGLYNYYVDTLGGIARMLRFFMGIPGGSKQQGIRQLNHAITSGELTSGIARIYLALNLHRFDQQYEQALNALTPVVEKYPSNPLFQLMRGDLLAKLGRKEQAAAGYRAAAALPVTDAACKARVQELARSSLAALGEANLHPGP